MSNATNEQNTEHVDQTSGTESAQAAPNVPASGKPKSPLGKADPVKRIIAFVIDAVISAIVSIIPFVGGLIGALYMLLRDALPIDFLDNKSVGKKLMNLSVVLPDQPGAAPDFAASAKRNWMFALGPIIGIWLLIPIIGWFVLIPLTILIEIVLGIIELVKVFSNEKGIP